MEANKKNDANTSVNDMAMVVEENDLDTDEEGGLRIDDEIYIPPVLKSVAQLDPNGPRLMITKIVNENFKSYAGTRVVGPFHKCFSAIIGPNGSGKSNVIDSMLFVFGYRASKIRSKKISVLIHNSSEHPNCTRCTVSVHFQRIIDKSESDYDIVPNSDFVISRTAFKDNSSYYELNKKKVQFKEIAKLLRSHGVDLDHNRFLILQGEVEQIAMMKPKGQNENDTGMLEFLEDIIGTVRYKEPLDKLFEKIEGLTEYRVEILNRLRIVEKEKAALEEPMRDVVQYLKLENAVTRVQYQLYHFKKFSTAKEAEKQKMKVTELSEDIAKLVAEMKSIHSEKEAKNQEMKEKAKAWDALQRQKDEVTAVFDKVRKQDESLHAELVETNKRRKGNVASLKSEKAKLEELEKVPAKNDENIKECERLLKIYIEDREREEEILATVMAGLKEQTEPLLKERSELEKQLILLRKNVDQAQAAFEIAKSEFELYTSLEHTEKEKLEKLKETLKITTETLLDRKKQLASLTAKIPASEQSLKQAQEELNQVKTEELQLTAKLKNMRISYEEKRSAMQASRSRNRVLDSLMREKREGRLPGIFGRLGDLGAINGKYDVAVSTACGPLDNIVVDTVQTAKACITFLRQNDIGRATFIALEKQQYLLPRCRERMKYPENVPRLFDLIEVKDERVLPAFYYGLHDTLVADNLDQATRIAYGQKRYRVVTLKGELIELSGTMSGGGRTVLKGRMGQTVVNCEPSTVDIDKLQSELDVVFEKCNHLRARQSPLENQISTLSSALKDMTMDSKKFTIEVKTLQEQEPSLRNQLKVQEKKAANSVSDPKKVEQLKKAVDAAKKHLDEVTETSKGVENDVERISRRIEEISGNRVKNQQKKISQLTKAIDKTKGEICRLQVAIKTSERDLQKTQKRIESLENDIQVCEQRLRDIQKEKQGLEEQAKDLLSEIAKYSDGLSERDEALVSLKEELNGMQVRENKIKSVKIDLDQKYAELKKLSQELEKEISEYSRRIKELKLQQIPSETVDELVELSEEEVEKFDEGTLIANLQKAKNKLPTEIPNMQIIAEYRDKDALYLKRAADLEEITSRRNNLRDTYETVRRRRIQEFLAGFTIITDKLKEMYQMITLGGDAELELVDSLDPFSEGVVFSVRPPKKSWKNICNLSGGEKTLSSLALVFALHHYKPTPLYFMDEIDAALDFKNVSIVANYIKDRTKNAQFIVISLRSNMFELANTLVGIYKTDNCTKCVVMHVDKYYKQYGIDPPTQLDSRAVYSSQMQRFLASGTQTQKQSMNSRSRNGSQSDSQNHEKIDTVELNLPDLGLCPTPVKNAVNQTEISSPTVAGITNDRSSFETPARKKRRI